MTRLGTTDCSVDDLPGCDTGPAGRLMFVVREALAAWRRHRATPPPLDDRTYLHLGGTR